MRRIEYPRGFAPDSVPAITALRTRAFTGRADFLREFFHAARPLVVHGQPDFGYGVGPGADSITQRPVNALVVSVPVGYAVWRDYEADYWDQDDTASSSLRVGAFCNYPGFVWLGIQRSIPQNFLWPE